MKLEDQVCSLELAKRLKEFGIKQESLFYWVDGIADNQDNGGYGVMLKHDWDSEIDFNGDDIYSAFTVAELFSLLPKGVSLTKSYDPEVYTSSFREYNIGAIPDKNPANALGLLLIELKEREKTN